MGLDHTSKCLDADEAIRLAALAGTIGDDLLLASEQASASCPACAEDRAALAAEDRRRLGDIFCRAVGPGGASVDFILADDGRSIDCVWTHENCPYLREGQEADPFDRAPDRHNVSTLTAEDLRRMLAAIETEENP